ncbi:hypothetical protein ACTXT7_001751 [Hymenolepis weldensis]
MTSNAADINNEILTSEKDRGNYNIQPPANPTLEQMQVARKESSSGFMLLSVRHTSNIGSLSNGREMHPLVENYDGNYVRDATMQATSNAMVASNPDMSRHSSSTMSLEAEEYDNNEDNPDPHSEPNQFSHNQQQQQHQFVMRNPPSNFNPAQIATMEPPVNGTQVVDGLRPVAVSNLAQIQLSPGAVPIQAAVVQSSQQPPPPIAAVPVVFHQINSHGSTLIPVASLDSLTQLQSAGILPGSTHEPRPSVQLTEISPFRYSDPSGMPPTVIAITSVAAMEEAAQAANLAPGQQTVSAMLNQPSIQSIIDQMTTEPLRSVSDALLSNPLLTSFNTPIQPASRFRKARIHETVEQWSSKRISLHDCHLKAVPDWVTYLQSRPIDTTFNHPIAQQGRCLYCFVPGNFGSQCSKHNHNQNFSKFIVGASSKYHHTRSATCSLPTVPETSEQSHIVQAAFTAYRAATQQGYNLKNLLSTWDSGERLANKALLEQFEHSLSPKSNKDPHDLKPNASDPVFASSTATQHQRQQIETAGHNSTDFSVNVPIQGNEELSNEGQTIVARPTGTIHQQQPSELVSVLEQPQAPPNGVLQALEVSPTHTSDPSVAYLRRQIPLNLEEGEAAARSECVQVQPPSTLPVTMPDQRLIAPPPTSPTLATLVVGGVEQTSAAVVAPAVSPRSMRSFSCTAIDSVQLSPDREMSGGIGGGIVAGIPQVPVPSTASSHNLTSIISSSPDHISASRAYSAESALKCGEHQQQFLFCLMNVCKDKIDFFLCIANCTSNIVDVYINRRGPPAYSEEKEILELFLSSMVRLVIQSLGLPEKNAKIQKVLISKTQAPAPAVGVVAAAPVVTTAAATTTDLARTVTPSVISNLPPAISSHSAAATSLDFSAASRNICEAVEAVANAYAPALAIGPMNTSSPSSMQISPSSPPLSQPPYPAMASNSPSSNNNTNATTTSVSGNLQAPVPKCMVLIGLLGARTDLHAVRCFLTRLAWLTSNSTMGACLLT